MHAMFVRRLSAGTAVAGSTGTLGGKNPVCNPSLDYTTLGVAAESGHAEVVYKARSVELSRHGRGSRTCWSAG